jgi:hypothetical protein
MLQEKIINNVNQDTEKDIYVPILCHVMTTY